MSAADDLSGEQLAAISREMVRLKAQHYGKGPTGAKTYACDDWLFCVMHGGTTPVEENLLEHGDGALVREVRMRFQENMGESFKDSVQRISGRTVVAYESQVLLDPYHMIEVFLLGEPIASGDSDADID